MAGQPKTGDLAMEAGPQPSSKALVFGYDEHVDGFCFDHACSGIGRVRFNFAPERSRLPGLLAGL
jgi:hypothetical protein